MKEKIEELIREGDEHRFDNNCYTSQYGTYSKGGVKLQSWIAEVEDFIKVHYGTDSAPWKIFDRLIIKYFDRYDREDFDRQKTIIISALSACLRITPKENKEQIATEELDLTKVFIVHGHDDALKNEVARYIEKFGLTSIILHEQPSSGNTIIEKIEENSNVGFGIVLYTPCDIGAKGEESANLLPRARQNVVFEHGFLIGKIGRRNVCALVKGNIEKPNDISGVVYISTEGEWKIAIAKELRNSGYAIDMNLVV
jgi:predicted nucleotide-binding protein